MLEFRYNALKDRFLAIGILLEVKLGLKVDRQISLPYVELEKL